jgi:inner membrane protease ATP23
VPQIRAANLSGDCRFLQEFFRGNIGSTFIGQQMRCVKRRAAMSVGMNPFCRGVAEQVVNDMMPACFKDTDPFPKIPNL